MSNFVYSLYSFLLLASGGMVVSCSAVPAFVHVRSIEEKQQTRSGKVFLQRRKNMEGVVTHYWFVDGESLTKEEFETAFSQAVAEEAVAELRRDCEAIEAEEAFNRKARKDLFVKLLISLQKEIRSYFDRVAAVDLVPFFVFSSELFESLNAFEVARDFLLQDISAAVALLENDRELEEFYNRYEKISTKITLFLQVAIRKAIDECTDTRVLKELLTLVS